MRFVEDWLSMPRGTKRDHNGEVAPMVGGELIQNKIGRKITKVKSNAILTNPERRLSKRVVKAKHKFDFVYEENQNLGQKKTKQSEANPGSNNNAQLDLCQNIRRKNDSRSSRVVSNSKSKKRKSMKSIDLDKQSKGNKAVRKIDTKRFDGIQVSVNSDEEELDYEDDIADPDELAVLIKVLKVTKKQMRVKLMLV